MPKSKISIAIIIILLASTVAFAVLYFYSQQDLQITKQLLNTQQVDRKILGFGTLFVEKVLKAEKEVSFEDRLRLENTVRDLNDSDVLAQWEKFTVSKTDTDAQKEVINLLELLLKKIVY